MLAHADLGKRGRCAGPGSADGPRPGVAGGGPGRRWPLRPGRCRRSWRTPTRSGTGRPGQCGPAAWWLRPGRCHRPRSTGSVLTTGGLGLALRTLAHRAPLSVELHIYVDGRLPEPVETGAYYTIAEALTNAAKHAHAAAVTITVDTTTDTDTTALRLTVHDDGVGGADLSRGTGLLGLKDRVEALGGYITLHSPPGEGTTLHAQIPLTTAPSTVG